MGSAEFIETQRGILRVPAIRPVTFTGFKVPENVQDGLMTEYSEVISDALAANSQFMGTMSPQAVYEELLAGNFSVVVDQGRDPWRLAGTALDVGELEKPEDNGLPRITRTIGTWLGANGNGRSALLARVDHTFKQPGVDAVVALVGVGNNLGRIAANKAGGRERGIRPSKRVPGAEVVVVQFR